MEHFQLDYEYIQISNCGRIIKGQWKNATRHTLSKKSLFTKIKDPDHIIGRDKALWSIRPDKLWKLTYKVKIDCQKNEAQLRKALADPEKFSEIATYGQVLLGNKENTTRISNDTKNTSNAEQNQNFTQFSNVTNATQNFDAGL